MQPKTVVSEMQRRMKLQGDSPSSKEDLISKQERKSTISSNQSVEISL